MSVGSSGVQGSDLQRHYGIGLIVLELHMFGFTQIVETDRGWIRERRGVDNKAKLEPRNDHRLNSNMEMTIGQITESLLSQFAGLKHENDHRPDSKWPYCSLAVLQCSPVVRLLELNISKSRCHWKDRVGPSIGFGLSFRSTIENIYPNQLKTVYRKIELSRCTKVHKIMLKKHLLWCLYCICTKVQWNNKL